MNYANKKESIVLFLGDLFILLDSLWITLVIRHMKLPENLVDTQLFWAFSLLSVIWVFSFYIAGLYRKQTLILRNRLPYLLLKTQIINVVSAIIFFYFVPFFSIAPKTILFIYLVVSSVFVYVWRVYIFKFIKPIKKHSAILVASGQDMKKLTHEVNNNNRYSFTIVNIVDLNSSDHVDLETKLAQKIKDRKVSVVIVDLKNEKIAEILPKLYNLLFTGIEFIDFQDVYESIFDSIPISSINYNWFLDNINTRNSLGYDFAKRLIDILLAGILIVPSLLVCPFVMFAVYVEDRKSPFIIQERIGKNNKIIKILKFRSMTCSDKGRWPTDGDSRITKVGKFIRATRIDELPQLLNVLKGDLSLVGPRPDIVGLYDNLEKGIEYYKIRNVVKPGLSGWAQTHQNSPPHSISETKQRLAYDLYYIKNRSLILDLKIAIHTLRIIISRTGK